MQRFVHVTALAIVVMSIGLAAFTSCCWSRLPGDVWTWLATTSPSLESHSDTLRNMGLVILGVLAIPLAIWRGWSADRQARAARESVLDERYQKAAEALDRELPAARLGGVYALESLAADSPGVFHVQVLKLLCAFVRNPPGVDRTGPAYTVNPIHHIPVRKLPPDPNGGATIATEADFLEAWKYVTRKPSAENRVLESQADYSRDLKGTELSLGPRAALYLTEADLACVYACEATWLSPKGARSSMMFAVLCKSRFIDADFTEANFRMADLRGAKFVGGTVSGASFAGADLTGASFDGTDLSGTTFSADRVVSEPARGLSQAALCKAVANPKPNLCGVVDSKDQPVIWNGPASRTTSVVSVPSVAGNAPPDRQARTPSHVSGDARLRDPSPPESIVPHVDPVIIIPGITAVEMRDEYELPPADVWTAVLHRAHQRTVLHPDDLRFEAREPARITPSHVFPLVYEELIEELRDDLSDDASVPVFPFAYDWRMPLAQTEDRLAAFIDEVLARTRLLPQYRQPDRCAPSRVNLVAHSMGGLIVAGYLSKYKGAKLARVVTLATPFQGSCDSIVEVITGTGRTILNPRKARKRRAARLTPAVYHLLPTYKGALEFDEGLNSDIFDPSAWQTIVVDSIARTARSVGVGEQSDRVASETFGNMLASAREHRQLVDNLNLNEVGFAPENWLAIVGIGEPTYVRLLVDRHNGSPHFRIEDSPPRDDWRRDLESRETGDGTVPLRGALPRFIEDSAVVCVTTGDFRLGERYDPPHLRFAGFHGQIPTMDLVHRMVVRFLTRAENAHGSHRGRPLPGVPTREWNPPVS